MVQKKSKVIEKDIREISEELTSYLPKIKKKTFLIAGGAGFLGRYLVMTLDYLNELIPEEPCKILILDNFISGLRTWIPEKETIRLIEHDISKPLEINEPIDYIINAASIASPLFYNKFRLETIDAGFLGTKNLLELAKQKNVKSFLFMSSSEVYGDPDPEKIPTKEDYLGNVSCTGPRACYDEPKRIGETLCMNYAEIYNLPIKIARPFNIFGPGIRLDDGRVAPTFVLAALSGKNLPVHGDGKNTRTFCYISNAIVGFFKILFSDRNKEVFNIGADEPEIQIKHLADIILGLVENEGAEIDLIEERAEIYKESDPNRRCPDLSKIRTYLGYNPRINLIAGLKRFITWAKEEAGDLSEHATLEKECRVCKNSQLKKIVSLGRSPLANNLVSRDEENEEWFYPLELMYCPICHYCQLSYSVDPDKMFKKYAYVTSTTETFRKHFSQMAEDIFREFNLPLGSLVVDIGSNDGLILKRFQELGSRVIGVEPAENVAEIARKNGVDTITDYFNEEVTDTIIKLKGNADVITANNVFAHTRYIESITRNVKRLLKDSGVFVIEVQYLLDTLKNMTFDNIYHEHVSYYNAHSITEFFRRQGMEVFKIARVPSHGGSLRVFVQKQGGPHQADGSVESLIKEEKTFGLDKTETYELFGDKIQKIRQGIVKFVKEAKAEGKTIVGYGAPAKATTLLNFCNITDKEIDFIIDDNPLKQNMLIPGVRIPIKNREALNQINPDYILILAWNFADEIIRNNISLRERGAKFIIPLPDPKIV